MTDMTGIDFNNYQWRVPVEIDGEDRYLFPHWNPMEYEEAADGIFGTVGEAVAYRDDMFPEEDTSEWVLFHHFATIVTDEAQGV